MSCRFVYRRDHYHDKLHSRIKQVAAGADRLSTGGAYKNETAEITRIILKVLKVDRARIIRQHLINMTIC